MFRYTQFLVALLTFWLFTGCGEPDPVNNVRNIYKGIVIDVNDNPVPNENITISGDGERIIASAITDSDGKYEVVGFTYGNYFELSSGTATDARYFLNYNETPKGIELEFPPLLSSQITSLDLQILNNSGNSLSVNFKYLGTFCFKEFLNNIEQEFSSCYEEINEVRIFESAEAAFSLSSPRGSDITVEITDGVNTQIETITLDQRFQNEIITFN